MIRVRRPAASSVFHLMGFTPECFALATSLNTRKHGVTHDSTLVRRANLTTRSPRCATRRWVSADDQFACRSSVATPAATNLPGIAGDRRRRTFCRRVLNRVTWRYYSSYLSCHAATEGRGRSLGVSVIFANCLRAHGMMSGRVARNGLRRHRTATNRLCEAMRYVLMRLSAMCNHL
jgi:hypothetical protein